jgi:hypothetical protein
MTSSITGISPLAPSSAGYTARASIENPATLSETTAKAREEALAAYKASQGDTVSISQAARDKAEQSDDTVLGAAAWKERFGLESGTTILKNGNKQVVTIEGSKIEILEYAGDKLVKSIKGQLDADSVNLDTEIYDKTGKVSQSINLELRGLQSDGAVSSEAVMIRNMKWFDSGELTRQMRDRMELTSAYAGVRPFVEAGQPDQGKASALSMEGLMKIEAPSLPETLEELSGWVTQDTHGTRYAASIQEYASGRLSREMSINQENESTNLTNRSDGKAEGLDGHTTRELSHANDLSFHITDYDTGGKLLRDVSFTEGHKDGSAPEGGAVDQSIAVSWYNQGELVKRGKGTLSQKETPSDGLHDRQSILETLGMTEAEYAGTTPESAPGLLSASLLESATEPGIFVEALSRKIASGAFNTAEEIARYGPRSNPYSIAWENETYKDGELAARSRDEESAKENPRPRDLSFRTGGGLTEDDTPATLRSTEHVEESYADGKLVRQGVVASHETLPTDEDGPDKVATYMRGSIGLGSNKQTVARKVMGELTEADGEANAASTAMSRELGLSLADVRGMLRSLNRSGAGSGFPDASPS